MKILKKNQKATGKSRIATKIALPLCCLIVILMTSFGAAHYIRTREAMTGMARDKGWSTVRAGTAFAAEHLQAGSPDLLKEMLSNIKTDPEVTYAYIVSASGKVVAQTSLPKGAPAVEQVESLPKEPFDRVTPGGIRKVGSIDFSTPIITTGGSTIGYFKLGLATRSLSTQLNAMLAETVLITSLSAIAGILLAVIITRRVLKRPIQDLMDATEHIASGDFTQKVPVHGMDELGCLSTGFNHMTVHLGNLFDSVRTSTAELNRSTIKIMNNTESIASSASPENQLEVIKEITGNARRMARLVDRLNNLSLQFKT